MSKILITGASGFVGSFLIEEALNEGLETYAGIRATSNKKWLQDDRIHFLELDLTTTNHLKEVIEYHQFDYIIHNAGVTKSNKKSEYFTVNVDYSKNLAEASLVSRKLKKFSFISSLAAFGPADYQKEKVLSNHSIPHPVTTYGHSKLKAERVLKELKSLPLIIFRPTGIFGPRESDFLNVFETINRGFAPSVGFEEQWISLIYVKDLVNIILKATISDIKNKAYFVTDGNLYPSAKFNRAIAESLGKNPFHFKVPLPLVYVIAGISEGLSRISGNASILNMDKFQEIKARNLDCDISNLVQDFDFKPKYDLQAAINETTEWYKENKWL
ncbi:MAG: NAD(P)-dependent oxidoreductase [Saprospiraceae bacterium]